MACFVATLPCWNIRAAAAEAGIPQELSEWAPWVLHGLENRRCPLVCDDADARMCDWPSFLSLQADRDGGRFRQQWLVFARGWLRLPGEISNWPRNVTLDDTPVPVMERSGFPHIFMEPGTHAIEGEFFWKTMPETLTVPPDTALVEIVIDQEAPVSPVVDSDGRVWLKKRSGPAQAEDKTSVKIFRLVDDSIPMEIESLLRLDISGRAREIRLNQVMVAGSIAMELKSPLPARIDPDGGLTVQGRPGRWEIRIASRLESSPKKLAVPEGNQGREIWCFKPRNHLRLLEIKGPPAVDPHQTEVPDNWRNFSAYIMDPGTEMHFEQTRRGNPDPAPDRLSLERTLWLDFDGKGYTIQDNITGELSRTWSLSMSPPVRLGRVAADGQDRLITKSDDGNPGVELRQGRLNLSADSRMDREGATIPAVGWDRDFQSVSAKLHIGPGWRLLHVQGVDSAYGTWFRRWSLLDLFLVLIVSLAVFKLKNAAWGALALATLALTFHEPGAPRTVWLSLLAAMALLRVLPQGWMKRVTRIWWLASILVLLAISIPFLVQQSRIGVYPQLEQGGGFHRFAPSMPGFGMSGELSAPMDAVKGDIYSRSEKEAPQMQQQTAEGYWGKRQMTFLNQAPDALVQTGPGLPDWTWRSFNLTFNGPVGKEQTIRLWLTPPWVNMLLCFARVALLAVLIFGFLDFSKWAGKGGLRSSAALLIAAFSAQFFMAAPPARASSSFPPEKLLQELQQRLLAPPECVPHCAQIETMKIEASPDEIRISLAIHAAIKTAVPLPASSGSWLPQSVFIDGQSAQGLARDKNGVLWALVEEGIHGLTMNGSAKAFEVIRLALPLKPMSAEIQADGWDVQGARADGRIEGSIQLTRLEKGEKVLAALEPRTLPPFFLVERELRLGLSWEIETTIKRLTPTGVSAVLEIPLLPNESVASEAARAENGKAVVHVEATSGQTAFRSTIEPTTRITLQAAEQNQWVESWVLDASPIWHCELSGIPVIYHQDENDVWRPQWRPWPGEKVQIQISRPEAVKGRMVTIEDARLVWTPGKRFSKSALSLTIRSSRGGRHQIEIPEDARLQAVKIDGESQPIGQEQGKVTVPLAPAKQVVSLEWNQPVAAGLVQKAPRVDLGQPAVNARIDFNLPSDRWVLWVHGPRAGPAVLFWSYLIVVTVAALGLGRETLTPLDARHWLLLGLGLTQISPWGALVVVGWLLALGFRKQKGGPQNAVAYNFAQMALVVLTAVALACLYTAIENGLLGIPRMQISGNGSGDFSLHWMQDRIEGTMPQPWTLTLHLWIYHILMLAWALWLALSLLKWLRWGWECVGTPSLWKKIRFRRKKDVPPPIRSKS